MLVRGPHPLEVAAPATTLSEPTDLLGVRRANRARHAPSQRRASNLWPAAVAIALYAALALAANWPTWPGDPTRMQSGDRDQMAWFLAWTPYAILHLHNIFATTWLNYPGGVNLAENTSSPLLGLLAAPVTLLVNPIASVNLLAWLAFPASAGSMYLVLRRWVRWSPAAFVGGTLYGFSPYVVAQARDHINLAFVPLPPLILLAAFETMRPGNRGSRRWGIALGCLLAAQFFISPEIAATTVLIMFVAAVALALARPHDIRASLRDGIGGLGLASVIVGVCVAYPIWVMVAGPSRYRGPAYPGGVSADLLGSLAPTSLQRFAPSGVSAAGSRLLFGNLTENGSYIGLPLIVLLAVLLAVCWRRPFVRFAALMALICVILSLGSHLVVANHETAVPLPWDLVQRLPFANDVITVRLALYTSLFAALLVALCVDDLHGRWADRVRNRPTPLRREGVVSPWPASSECWRSPACPRSFRHGRSQGIRPQSRPTSRAPPPIGYPPGTVALLSPYPSVEATQAQLWQAVAGMRFRIIGGYSLFADPQGNSTNFPEVLQPADVQRFLWSSATGGAAYPVGKLPPITGRLVCQFRGFLTKYDVDTVISTAEVADPMALDTLFTDALGRPSISDNTVKAWYEVRAKVVHDGRSCRS